MKSSASSESGSTRISVVLASYNLERFLADAIEGILNQSFGDFELLVIDDGSSDRSVDIAEGYARRDARVRVVRHESNLGISATLNQGLRLASEEWVALMDGDDVALPARFERQIAYIAANPDLSAVGCFPLMVDDRLRPITTLDIYRESHEDIEAALLAGHGWAFLQPTALIRKSAALAIGGFREDLPSSMDLDFFLRLAEAGRIANVPEVLYLYRMRTSSVTHAASRKNYVRHNTVLDEAYERRGMPGKAPHVSLDAPAPSPADHFLKWGWWALSAGNAGTARWQAWRALRLRPFSLECYKLLACAIRGY